MCYQEAWEIEQKRERRASIIKQSALVLVLLSLVAVHFIG